MTFRIPGFLTRSFLFVCTVILRIWYATLRKRVEDPHEVLHLLDRGNGPAVVAITWHNRLLFFPLIIPKTETRRAAAVISASKDGDYLSELLVHFKVKALRGSSSRNGMLALHNALKTDADNTHVVITPDGPRGPCYKMSNGPVFLASKLNRLVIPLCINASCYVALNTWDKFQVPLPFTRLTLKFGKPISVPETLSHELMEAYCEQFRLALMSLTEDKVKKGTVPPEKTENQPS